MTQLLTDKEFAATIGRTLRTVRNMVSDGAPHHGKGKDRRWDMDEVKAWLYHKKNPTANTTAAPGQLSVQESQDLAEKIRNAKTETELAELTQEVAAWVSLGRIRGDTGRALKALISEARLCRKAGGAAQDLDKALFATEQGYELLEIFEQVIDGRLRTGLLEDARRILAQDKERFPDDLRENPDALVEALKQHGLNAWGDVSE